MARALGIKAHCLRLLAGMSGMPKRPNRSRKRLLQLRIYRHLLSHSLGDGLTSQVIARRTEPPGGQDEIGPTPGTPQHLNDIGLDIPNLGDPDQLDAQQRHLFRQKRGVGIRRLTHEKLSADGDYFCFHYLILKRPVARRRRISNRGSWPLSCHPCL